MDPGINGRTAAVCGSSRGLAHGHAQALAAEGVQRVMLARSAESLEAPMRAAVAGIRIDGIRQRQLQTNPARRYGNSREFGATCAYPCNDQASHITAQNGLLDGGVL